MLPPNLVVPTSCSRRLVLIMVVRYDAFGKVFIGQSRVLAGHFVEL